MYEKRAVTSDISNDNGNDIKHTRLDSLTHASSLSIVEDQNVKQWQFYSPASQSTDHPDVNVLPVLFVPNIHAKINKNATEPVFNIIKMETSAEMFSTAKNMGSVPMMVV